MDLLRLKHHMRRPVALVVVIAAAATMWLLPRIGAPSPSREQYPVRGIDISAHNGDIDFSRVAADSIDFVIIKATEGATFKDARFRINHSRAAAAGLKTGAYHFFRFDIDGTLQAMNLVNSVINCRLDLPLIIDVEEWTNPDDVHTDHIKQRLGDMVDYLHNSGYSVAVYTNRIGHRRFLADNFSTLPLWICSFTDPPVKGTWHLWQYSHRGRVSGIDGHVDMNVFNGSRAHWHEFLHRSATTRF